MDCEEADQVRAFFRRSFCIQLRPGKTSVHNSQTRLFMAMLFLVAFAFSAKAQQGWTATRVGPAGRDLNTVFFLDNKRGWVGGDGGFRARTDDGGTSWVPQKVDTADAINDIYFRDKEIGFVLAGNAIFSTRDDGRSEERRVGKECRSR